MWVVYGLLGLLATAAILMLLLLLVPLRVRVAYDGELLIRLRVLSIPITLSPNNSTEKPTPKKAKKTVNKGKKATALQREITAAFQADGVGATLAYLGELAQLTKKAVGKALRSITVDKLQLEMLLATGDPSETARLYGQVCGILYPTLAALENGIQVKKRHLRIEPNFLLEDCAVCFDVRLHVRVFQLAGAALALLWRYFTIKETISDETKEEHNNG